MFNALHAKWKRPERGFDPVPAAHVAAYGEGRWSAPIDEWLLDHLDEWTGGLKGRSVLDLGGGPGQYSIAFAKRGASVTWHDVSKRYQEFVVEKARQHGVQLGLSLGYLDEAPEILKTSFDLVFNRVCWNYGITDASFARVVYRLAKPGGIIFVDTATSEWGKQLTTRSGRIRTEMNNRLRLKIGHPYPPSGRVLQLLAALPHDKVLADYTRDPNHDYVTMRRL